MARQSIAFWGDCYRDGKESTTRWAGCGCARGFARFFDREGFFEEMGILSWRTGGMGEIP